MVGADILGLWGQTEALLRTGAPFPLLWFELFAEGGPVERLQWSFLTLALAGCAGFGLRSHAEGLNAGRSFSILFGFGLSLMLMEDALNIRHHLANAVVDKTERFEERMLRTIVELPLYGALGLLMVGAFVKFSRDLRDTVGFWGLLVTGYLFYGVAAVGSATRHIGDWYQHAGSWALERVPHHSSEAMGIAQDLSLLFYDRHLGFYFMDQPIEESLELLGAGCLAAFCFGIYRWMSSTQAARVFALGSSYSDLPDEPTA